MAAATSAAAVTAPAESYHDVEAGFTADGYAYLGKSDSPVTLEEWSDYACPFCGRHFRQTWPGLFEKYVRPGKLKLVFRDFPLEGLHPTAITAHVAARCAGQGHGATYWAYHDALFEKQAAWARLPDPGAFLAETARSLGVESATFQACLAAGEASKFVAGSVAAGQALEFNGTPQFRFLKAGTEPFDLSGAQPQARFEAIIEALLAGKEPPPDATADASQPAELPAWAKRSGLAPDPGRHGYTVAGDTYKGDPKAPLAVVEFSDFQCDACRKHALEVQPAIEAALVGTGKVLWVSKHHPLRMHPQAVLAAVAAECAGDQGRYWEMRRKLFETSDRWTNDRAEQELPALATELGLDRSAFARCFDGRKALERVLVDLYDAKGIVERTPSFVILSDDKTGSITGPLPADQFIRLLQDRAAGAVVNKKE
jgi:protein-disulfide isomerase